jgi:hypothetical protein
MIEAVRIRGGEICIPPHPGGIFTGQEIKNIVKEKMNAKKVTMVSREVWLFLEQRYNIEKII